MGSIKKAGLALAISLAVGLAGCGGGGGSSSRGGSANNPGPTDPGPGSGSGDPTLQVAGTAVKGVLKFAKVTAWELDEFGGRLSPAVGSTETDEQGDYELSLGSSYTGGALEVEVSAIAGTLMECDASHCGSATTNEDVEVPSGFILTALVESADSEGVVNAPVTAWSTMAAKRVKTIVADGKSLDEANRQAHAEVSQLVGFDIASTPAKGLSQIKGASGSEVQYALVNAAVAEVLFQSGGSDALTDRLEQFTDALSDGTVGDSDDAFTMADLARALHTVTSNVADLDRNVHESVQNQVAQLEAAGADGFTPVYDEALVVDKDATDAEKIEAYRNFVTQVRTWVSSIEALDGNELAKSLELDPETVGLVVDEGTQARIQFLGEVVDQVGVYLVENVSTIQDLIKNGGERSIAIKDNDGQDVGSVKMTFSNDNGLRIDLNGSVTGSANEVFAPFQLVLDTSIPIDALRFAQEEEGKINLTLARLLASNTLNLKGTISDEAGNAALELKKLSLNLELNQATAELDEVMNLFRSASLSGELAIQNQGASFSGEVSASLVRLGAEARIFEGLDTPPVSLSDFRLSGEFVSPDGAYSFATSVAVDVRNAAGFDTFAWTKYSAQNRRVNGKTEDTEPFVALAGPELADAVYTRYSVSVSGYGHPYFSTWGYAATDQLEGFYVGFTGNETKAMLATLKPSLEALLPSVIIQKNVETNVTKKLSTQDLFEEGELVSFHFGPLSPFYKFALELPSGTDADNMEWGFSEDTVGVAVSNDGDQLLHFFSDNREPLSVLEPFLGPYLLHDVIPYSLYLESFDSRYSYGEFQYLREATLENYQACLVSPNEHLARIYPWASIEQACAELTLAYAWGNSGELNGEPLEDIRSLMEEVLIEHFGDNVELASQLSFDRFSIYGDNDAAQYSVSVDFPDLETAENFLEASFTLSSRVNIPELQSAQVTATVNRTSYRGGSIRANVQWNGGNYTLVLEADDIDKAEFVSARFFNAQGYELEIDVSLDEGKVVDLEGKALISGEQVGRVELRDGRIPVIVYAEDDEEVFDSLY